MKRRFGGGRQPTGTPSLAWSCIVVIVSLLAGASVIHNVFNPDLALPPWRAYLERNKTSRRKNEWFCLKTQVCHSGLNRHRNHQRNVFQKD
uniref:Uncharacterized protein n=1 Tax=Nelumbo nucifera TaxID=4432 RepID=A0A822YTS0_NELNU|nr:TPA_asm: hypothetical protein HUJ06_005155 [Nelumbo nucifera]